MGIQALYSILTPMPLMKVRLLAGLWKRIWQTPNYFNSYHTNAQLCYCEMFPLYSCVFYFSNKNVNYLSRKIKLKHKKKKRKQWRKWWERGLWWDFPPHPFTLPFPLTLPKAISNKPHKNSSHLFWIPFSTLDGLVLSVNAMQSQAAFLTGFANISDRCFENLYTFSIDYCIAALVGTFLCVTVYLFQQKENLVNWF